MFVHRLSTPVPLPPTGLADGFGLGRQGPTAGLGAPVRVEFGRAVGPADSPRVVLWIPGSLGFGGCFRVAPCGRTVAEAVRNLGKRHWARQVSDDGPIQLSCR